MGEHGEDYEILQAMLVACKALDVDPQILFSLPKEDFAALVSMFAGWVRLVRTKDYNDD